MKAIPSNTCAFTSRLRISVTAMFFAIFVGNLHAEQFRFDTNRFGYITMKTSKDSAKVVFTQGDKQSEEITWQGTLKAVDKETFITNGGTTFKLTKLDKKVVNDGNREINSGSWKLVISGKGADYEMIKKKRPFIAFGDETKTECYGEKTE